MKNLLLNLVDLTTGLGVEGFALNYGIEVTRGPLLFFLWFSRVNLPL